MATRKSSRTKIVEDQDQSADEHTDKGKVPSLRVQLSCLTVVQLKNLLRYNHQNPFGTKAVLISRIVQCVKNGCYPSCPKCSRGRLKLRLHRRRDQSKYFCPGYPLGFRAPASFHHCDYQTDECVKEKFRFPSDLHLIVDE